ncbi:MAG TPA: hypothetical protein DCO72_08700 [Ruminococcus sp.]|nr:hypothetical protein [Ruminococcus sp.]
MTLLEFLKSNTNKEMLISELTDVFSEMCMMQPDENDELLFQTGTEIFVGEKCFHVSFVRYRTENEIHMDVMYPLSDATRFIHGNLWNTDVEGDFFRCVRSSKAFCAVEQLKPLRIDIYTED